MAADEQNDILLKPGLNADSKDEIGQHISNEVLAKYDVYSYRHAAMIMNTSFPDQLAEIEAALLDFSITTYDIEISGGNESNIPKKFSTVLRPKNWNETSVEGDLVIRVFEEKTSPDKKKRKKPKLPSKEVNLKNYIDGHKIDYLKGRVALELEWNSKDQTYDRDLYAFRMFHECGIISVASIITRSATLEPVFHETYIRNKDGNFKLVKDKKVLCKKKYGASTTWMGKLLYRLNAGRHGGCPVLVVGIRPDVISDWNND